MTAKGTSMWPVERLKKFEALHAQGYGGSEIARELGVSSNVVLGKIWRAANPDRILEYRARDMTGWPKRARVMDIARDMGTLRSNLSAARVEHKPVTLPVVRWMQR